MSQQKFIQSPIKEISDLLDSLSLDARVQQTCQLLAAVPTLPTGAAHSWAALETEQFGFRLKHSTSLQLPCLPERVTRNSREKRLVGVVS
jgi:hypothetical protein